MVTTSRGPSRHACGPSALALSIAGIVAERAHAHGVGTRYELPIPLWLYLAGAGLTVALSFGALAFFARTGSGSRGHGGVPILRWGPGPHGLASWALLGLRAVGVGLYLMLIYAGLFGAQSPLKNITPVMVWAVWWVGMIYVSALLGHVWALLNPLDTLFAWGEALHARLHPARPLSQKIRYPERLGP